MISAGGSSDDNHGEIHRWVPEFFLLVCFACRALNTFPLPEILTCAPNFVRLEEISPFDIMFFSFVFGFSGLITNLGSTNWALVKKDIRD